MAGALVLGTSSLWVRVQIPPGVLYGPVAQKSSANACLKEQLVKTPRKENGMKDLNPSIIGQITELKCQLFLVEQGFNVLIPMGNHQKYDLY